ncbi:MAG: hypothetical protein IPL06_03475 [Betaproteobacteria bacterium]|nr:hypothetical protein [Betaproteobacteria bacterium]
MKIDSRNGLLLLGLSVALGCAWLNPLENAAIGHVDAGMKRALASFATARTLGALLSVAQGTDIAIEPAGVGVKFAPGQALRPVNEVVSQFADLMLAASVAFGVMRVSIAIASHWVFSACLTGVGLTWAWYRWRGSSGPGWLSRLVLAMLLVRFAIPLATIGTEAVFQGFLSAEYGPARLRSAEAATT